jgi:hypothetical protein
VVKWPGREAGRSPPTRAEVKKILILPHVFMEERVKHRSNFFVLYKLINELCNIGSIKVKRLDWIAYLRNASKNIMFLQGI